MRKLRQGKHHPSRYKTAPTIHKKEGGAMTELLDAIERKLLSELEKDPSWKYVPVEAREEILAMHLDKIAEWLVIKTKGLRS